MMAPEPCDFMTGTTACMASMVPKRLVSKCFVAGCHIHASNGVEHAVAGVVDPDINPLEVMNGQADGAVDLFAMADVASQREGTVAVADAGAGGFGASGITGQKRDAGSLIDKKFGNGFADAHRSAGDHYELPESA